MNFCLWPGPELKRVSWNQHRVLVERRGVLDAVYQAVAFTHPKRGDHVVYVDTNELDAEGMPSGRLYVDVLGLLEAVDGT